MTLRNNFWLFIWIVWRIRWVVKKWLNVDNYTLKKNNNKHKICTREWWMQYIRSAFDRKIYNIIIISKIILAQHIDNGLRFYYMILPCSELAWSSAFLLDESDASVERNSSLKVLKAVSGKEHTFATQQNVKIIINFRNITFWTLKYIRVSTSLTEKITLK